VKEDVQLLTFLEDNNFKGDLNGCTKEWEPKISTKKLLEAALIEVSLYIIVH
jgi:hypothetical protein